MDTVMKKIGRLAEMARSESLPRPLDAGGIMARIRDLTPEEEETVLAAPLRFWAGGAAAAAAAAIVMTFFAVSAWVEMGDPTTAVESLFDVMEVI